jgi:hypothetical protein
MDTYDHNSTSIDPMEPYVWRLTERGKTVATFALAVIITAMLIAAAWIGQERKADRLACESNGTCQEEGSR